MIHGTLLQLIRIRRTQSGRRTRRPKRLPRQVWPYAIERQYAKDAVALVRRVHAVLRRDVFPQLESWIAMARRERGDSSTARLDDASKTVRDVMRRVRAAAAAALPDAAIESVSRTMGDRTATFQKQQLDRQLNAALGVDVPFLDRSSRPRVEGFVHQNVQLIQSVPTRLLDEVEYQVLNAVGKDERAETLADSLEDRFEVSESRAELIARDQVGKLFGQLNQDRQEGLGLTAYVWRTAMDESVRPEHADREGQSFEWGDPPEDGNPGEPIGCRCYGEPDVQEILDELEG